MLGRQQVSRPLLTASRCTPSSPEGLHHTWRVPIVSSQGSEEQQERLSDLLDQGEEGLTISSLTAAEVTDLHERPAADSRQRLLQLGSPVLSQSPWPQPYRPRGECPWCSSATQTLLTNPFVASMGRWTRKVIQHLSKNDVHKSLQDVLQRWTLLLLVPH